MLLGNFDLDLESKARQSLTFNLNKKIRESIDTCYWHELAVPFIQAIPSLQAGEGYDEDHSVEVAVLSDDDDGMDTPLEAEARGSIASPRSRDQAGTAISEQADESVQEVGGYFSVAALAQKHDVPREALDQRLRRLRNKNAFGCEYIKNKNPAKAKTDPSYVYFEPTIIHHISALKKRQR